MKKMPVFPFFICSASFIVNMHPALLGFSTQPFESISLISSTTAWFSYLFSLYFFGAKDSKRTSLVYINVLLYGAIILPLLDVFIKYPENIQTASNGILSGIYVFLNYASRISLLLFAISVLMKKETLLRIVMFSLLALIFTSFLTCVYELIVLLNQSEETTIFSLISTILNPIAIFSAVILQLYFIINRKEVVEALK